MKKVLVMSLLAIGVMFVFGGNPKTIYYDVVDLDGVKFDFASGAPYDNVTFRAWITGRENEEIDMNSLGCGYYDTGMNSYLFIQVGSFPTSWSIGDEINFEASDNDFIPPLGCKITKIIENGEITEVHPVTGKLETPALLIDVDLSNLTIDCDSPDGAWLLWDKAVGAEVIYVYYSDDPYADEPWDCDSIDGNATACFDEPFNSKMFYKVKAYKYVYGLKASQTDLIKQK
ncbi:MAG: hypothetical protein PHF33_07135 [Candidatus Delongbacteria bacterium]|nr:hypothetical protein [Candidatus Delongbacteria bacterium]